MAVYLPLTKGGSDINKYYIHYLDKSNKNSNFYSDHLFIDTLLNLNSKIFESKLKNNLSNFIIEYLLNINKKEKMNLNLQEEEQLLINEAFKYLRFDNIPNERKDMENAILNIHQIDRIRLEAII